MNKISFEKPVFTVFYQKPLAARIYKNKSIRQSTVQVEANQPRYYISISMITRKKVQKLV